MNLKELIEKLNLGVRTAQDKLDRKVTGGYVSDLLSDVIANGKEGDLWVTLQTHQNVVAVASLKNLAAILLINGREPQDETKKKAEAEGIPITVSEQSAFEVVGRLYALGVR